MVKNGIKFVRAPLVPHSNRGPAAVDLPARNIVFPENKVVVSQSVSQVGGRCARVREIVTKPRSDKYIYIHRTYYVAHGGYNTLRLHACLVQKKKTPLPQRFPISVVSGRPGFYRFYAWTANRRQDGLRRFCKPSWERTRVWPIAT